MVPGERENTRDFKSQEALQWTTQVSWWSWCFRIGHKALTFINVSLFGPECHPPAPRSSSHSASFLDQRLFNFNPAVLPHRKCPWISQAVQPLTSWSTWGQCQHTCHTAASNTPSLHLCRLQLRLRKGRAAIYHLAHHGQTTDVLTTHLQPGVYHNPGDAAKLAPHSAHKQSEEWQ